MPGLTLASNAGIVRGLWYDHETVFAGKPVRIYVAVRNNTGGDLSGTVEFFVNGSRIERNNIAALDGRIVESWADWTPRYGTSTVSATLSRTELTTTASGTKAVAVVSNLAEDTFFVDYDTDHDAIGDVTDTDDDGDGISDSDETAAGTNPKKYDPPKVTEATSVTENDEAVPVATESADTSNTSPVGLEQFLTPSRADTILTNISTAVTEAKDKLDTYRMARHTEAAIEAGAIAVPVNGDGFGEIERTSKDERNKPTAEKPGGFFGDVITFFGNIIGALYTGLLFVLSWLLGHPILVQLLLLLLILGGLIFTAKRLSRRPR